MRHFNTTLDKYKDLDNIYTVEVHCHECGQSVVIEVHAIDKQSKILSLVKLSENKVLDKLGRSLLKLVKYE